MASEKKAKPRNYCIVLPISRTEMRTIEKKSQAEVDSYLRRNLKYNFKVFEGKDITRLFRR